MSVSQEVIDIVKSTVPLLETGSVALTSHFYQILFDEVPAARDIFNMTNQATGKQPVALANAVLCFAKHIDALSNLTEAVENIVHKHISFQIKDPALYGVVGKLLLRSIREVLGEEIATKPVIDAWGEAYAMLANILIKKEASMYRELAKAPGGWSDARNFIVTDKFEENSDTISFTLTPEDGKEVLIPHAGQYITFRRKFENQTVTRQYSISDTCDGNKYRITVKKIVGGLMSSYLHDEVQIGDVIPAFTPCGAFQLSDDSRPLTAIAAGVGITPMISICKAAIKAGRSVTLLQYIHSYQNSIFNSDLEELRNLGVFVQVYYTGGTYRDNALKFTEDFDSISVADSEVYCVGPSGFMEIVNSVLKDMGVESPKYEYFTPAQPMN